MNDPRENEHVEAATEQAADDDAPVLDDTAAEAAAGEAADGDDAVAALEAQVEALKEEVLRARAEMDNVRKRAERDVEAAHKYGQERLVNELLPVKDSIDLGLQAAAGATDVEALREGMALTEKAFGDFLDKLAVLAVDPLGERFDPEQHQAMTMEESVEHAPGTVMRVMQKGYLLNERLLRPALVVVAKAAAAGSEAAGGDKADPGA